MRIDLRKANVLELRGKRFFLFRSGREVLLVADACPHRGGPLHLGQWNPHTQAVQCPWHTRSITLKHLRKDAIPLVVRREEAVAVFPELPDAPVRSLRRIILAGEGAPEGNSI